MASTSSTVARPTPPLRSEFTTSDPERAREFLDDAYGSTLRMQGAEAGQQLRHVRLDGGAFCIDDIDLPPDIRFNGDPLGLLAVVHIGAGQVERETGGAQERFVAGDLILNSGPDVPYAIRTRQVSLRTVVLQPSLVDDVAPVPSADGPASVRFTALTPRSSALADHWRHTVDHLDTHLFSSPELAGQPLLVGQAARLLAAAALVTFPNTALEEPKTLDDVDASSSVLRRAVQFIDDHAQHDISLRDISEAAHVTTRAVQYAFRRHLDTTPTAYLRRVRLEGVHADLLAADPTDGTTVTAIAARWGFFNQGRFAALYRSAYGRSPKEALQR